MREKLLTILRFTQVNDTEGYKNHVQRTQEAEAKEQIDLANRKLA